MRLSFFSILAAQDAHVMPPISSSTHWPTGCSPPFLCRTSMLLIARPLPSPLPPRRVCSGPPDQLVAGLVDRGADRLVVHRLLGADGQQAGGGDRRDGGDAGDRGDLAGDRGLAVAAAHSGHRVDDIAHGPAPRDVLGDGWFRSLSGPQYIPPRGIERGTPGDGARRGATPPPPFSPPFPPPSPRCSPHSSAASRSSSAAARRSTSRSVSFSSVSIRSRSHASPWRTSRAMAANPRSVSSMTYCRPSAASLVLVTIPSAASAASVLVSDCGCTCRAA